MRGRVTLLITLGTLTKLLSLGTMTKLFPLGAVKPLFTLWYRDNADPTHNGVPTMPWQCYFNATMLFWRGPATTLFTWTGSARTKLSKSSRSRHMSGLVGHTLNTQVLSTRPNYRSCKLKGTGSNSSAWLKSTVFVRANAWAVFMKTLLRIIITSYKAANLEKKFWWIIRSRTLLQFFYSKVVL